jgi:hypothetical protein
MNWHRLMISFLYPAMLGNIMFTGIPALFYNFVKTTEYRIIPYSWIPILLFFIYFTRDFLYGTGEFDASESRYTVLHAVCDFGLIVCLYLGVASFVPEQLQTIKVAHDIRWAIGAMVCAKVLGVVWEIVPGNTRHEADIRYGWRSDLFFLVLYLLALCIALKAVPIGCWMLCVSLSLDIIFYDKSIFDYPYIRRQGERILSFIRQCTRILESIWQKAGGS